MTGKGRRFHVVIYDDPYTDKPLTDEQKRKLEIWYKIVLKAKKIEKEAK
jgi:hypothetical protein